MSENKHTSGEWFAQYANEGWQVCVNPKYALEVVYVNKDKVKDGDCLADSPRWRSFEECEANAQLIAAAPDLLEACEFLLKEIEILGTYAPIDEICKIGNAKARKAIAKAKGENET